MWRKTHHPINFPHFLGDKHWEPLFEDNVLVCSNGELPGTVEQPLILLPVASKTILLSVVPELLRPPVVHSEPQDAHGEKEGVLVASGVPDSCR